MKKTSLLFLSAMLTAPGAFAGFDLDRPSSELSGRIASVEVAQPEKGLLDIFKPKPKSAKEWTIMVFINGKNDLERYAIKDMNEMEMVGSNDKLNIVTQTGRIEGYDSSNGDWKGVRRYYITKDSDTSIVNSRMVQDMGQVDMGDYKSVVAFARWAKQNYPAKKYMLIVWNHGSGWEKSLRPRITKGLSYDEQSGNHMTTPQLGQALREIGGLDVYGSDACLMQMAEVVYELKDNVKYIVGSEETEPGDGYTYDLFLGPLAANPAMTAEQVAKLAVDAYSDHYQSIGEGSTQSFLQTSAIPEFTAKVNAFAEAVMASGKKDAFKSAASSAQNYAISDNKDLYDLAGIAAANIQDPAVSEKAALLQDFIKNGLILHNRTNNSSGGGWDDWDDWGNDYPDYPDYYRNYQRQRSSGKSGRASYDKSHGIAVYAPGYSMGAGYGDLAWASASKWDELINWYQGR